AGGVRGGGPGDRPPHSLGGGPPPARGSAGAGGQRGAGPSRAGRGSPPAVGEGDGRKCLAVAVGPPPGVRGPIPWEASWPGHSCGRTTARGPGPAPGGQA